MLTPTPYPTAVGTPVIQMPDAIGADAAMQAVQVWNMFGGFGTAIQVAVLLMIVFGGLLIIIRNIKEI